MQASSATIVRCGKSKGSWRCKNLFPQEFHRMGGKVVEVKCCPHHRAQGRSQYASERGQATKKAYKSTTKYLEGLAKHRQTKVYKDTQKRHDKTDKRKKQKADMHQARVATPGGKMHNNICGKISRMITGAGYESQTVRASTMIESKETLREHFSSQFGESGMSWDNYGLEDGTWQIGHRIARAMYDHSNPDDVKRCWSLQNLFPQWSKENRELGVALPAEAELAELRDIFPSSWLGVCPVGSRRQELERACGRV